MITEGLHEYQVDEPWNAVDRMCLAIEPEDVVLSALKVAEDADGLIVRVSNSSSAHLVATLYHPELEAVLTDLAERLQSTPRRVGDCGIEIPLQGRQIATVRLKPPAGGGAS